MTQPAFPIYPVPPVPPPEMVIRSRRELSTRDTVNARQFEHWQTDGKYGVNNRPDMNKQAPFTDFLPINSRFETRDYHPQPRFDEGGHRLGMNTYFEKYDPTFDSRNAVRELRSAVYEDKNIETVRESQRLLTRGMDNRWVVGDYKPGEQPTQKLIAAMEALRPQHDDIHRIYR